jgi:hypothetical protein
LVAPGDQSGRGFGWQNSCVGQAGDVAVVGLDEVLEGRGQPTLVFGVNDGWCGHVRADLVWMAVACGHRGPWANLGSKTTRVLREVAHVSVERCDDGAGHGDPAVAVVERWA